MRAGVAGFQPGRLTQVRLARGMTQTTLATLVGRSSGTVSKWEKGEQTPESDALDRLAAQLVVPASWFLRRIDTEPERPCFFRSNASITKVAQNIARVRLQWLNEISRVVQGWIDWPPVNVPAIGKNDHLKIVEADIERAAQECRQLWKLGLGPISDVVLVLENAGIICAREELGYTKMDGASQWFDTDGRPYVYLAADKANGVRSRFDAAHELGHLVLHRDIDYIEFNKRYPELERQAHYFAAAFLLPAESFAAEVARPTLDTFIALKPRWKVSVAAMIMRCKQLEIIDEEYAVRLWKNYSARGWRRGEPLDDRIEFESIRLLPRAVKLLLSEGGLTKDGLVAAMGLSATDCESLCALPQRFFDRSGSVEDLASIRLKRTPSTDGTDGQQNGRVIAFPQRT